jgi:hypothetical protein
MKKKVILILISACLVFLFLYLLRTFYLFLKERTPIDTCYEAYLRLKSKEYCGVVNRKFQDIMNHGSITIEIKRDSSILKWPVANEKSGLYQYIKLNDSIVKESGSFEVLIYRNSVYDTLFVLDYDCP